MNTSLNRRANTRFAVAASTCAAVIVVVSACGGGGGGGGDGPGSESLDLTIGNVLPLHGKNKQMGESGEKASALALDQIKNAVEDVAADHSVRTVEENQGGDVDSASRAAKTLVDEQGANCVTGPWSADAVVKVASEVTVPAEVLEISPVPATDDVSELNDHDLVDSTSLPVSLEGSALSEGIEQELGRAESETVNLAASNETYATTLSQDFLLAWQDKEGTIGAQIALPAPPSTSSSDYTTTSSSDSSTYSTQVSQLFSNSPDAVVLIDTLDGFLELAPSLSSSSSWNPETVWGSDELVSPALPAEAGDAVDGMRALAPGIPKGEDASSAFVDEFKSADPRDVKLEPYAAQEFDATVLCYLAAVAAGSTDGRKMADELIDITAPGGDEFSWQQLPDAIKALQDGEDIDYTGASGPIDMDVRGDPTRGVFDVYRYSGERLEVVGEVTVEKPNPAAP